VLTKIPEELQTVVAERICTIDRIAPEVLAEVDRVLKKKFSMAGAEEYARAGGVETVVGILNVASRSIEKFVVETMENSNPALAEEIKKRMFVFEDIVLLDRDSVGRVLKEANEQDVLLALKAAPENVQSFIWECVPRGELEKLKSRFAASGRARLSDVDAAQQRIVGLIRALEEQGKIVVSRAEEMIE
jgi:flagellar motor switch protein FliG